MLTKKQRKVMIGYLPIAWRSDGALKFGKSSSYIEKVAYGQTENLDVLDYLIDLAETGKKLQEAKEQELKLRIKNLA